MNNKNNGFTIIEILVVMLIVAGMLAMGISSYNNFMKNTIISESASDLIAILKQTQNLAKNNSLPKTESSNDKIKYRYYYLLNFENLNTNPYGKIGRKLYKYDGVSWTIVSEEDDISSKMIDEVKYRSDELSNCKYVLFENMTGKIKVSSSEGTIINVASSIIEECKLEISINNDQNYRKTIYINSSDGQFGYVNEK